MKYFVSRQRYWDRDDENCHVVEVATGGLDYANPDMLGVRWPHLGEGREYSDPREALEAAIRVCEEWKQVEPHAQVGMGATLGFTQSFDGEPYEDLRKRANEMWERLPKCAQCGELLGKETYTHDLVVGNEESFCSEGCADKAYNYEVLNDLHATATEYFQDPKLSWEEKYDKIFSDDISTRVFAMIRLDYCDPDTTYEEDVTAFMTAFDAAMEKRK